MVDRLHTRSARIGDDRSDLRVLHNSLDKHRRDATELGEVHFREIHGPIDAQEKTVNLLFAIETFDSRHGGMGIVNRHD
jgi:hypothetical protein